MIKAARGRPDVNTVDDLSGPGTVRTAGPRGGDASEDALRAALRHRRLVPSRWVTLDPDPEGARLQLIQVDVWSATTLACLVGLILTMIFGGAGESSAWLWLAFIPPLAAAAVSMAKFPQWRPRITMSMYLLVLCGGAWVLFSNAAPQIHGFNTLWGVLTGATIAERPRRAIFVGLVCCAVLGASMVVGNTSVNVGATAASAALGLVVSAVLGGITWQTTLDELLDTHRHTAELTGKLSRTNAELEARVAERKTELEKRSAELQVETERLRESLDGRARLARELNDLAHRDDLTALRNRRSFMEQLALSIDGLLSHTGTGPTGDPAHLTVLLVDVDYFKTVNDRFGHPVGDRALIHIANALADAIRTDDTVARIGGEEFAVILPSTSAGTGMEVAQELRMAVAALDTTGLGMSQRLTVSIGGVTFVRDDIAQLDEADARGRRHDATISWAMSSADKALYEAKDSGRNTVRWSGVDVPTPKSGDASGLASPQGAGGW